MSQAETGPKLTHHAMLVLWGQFAQRIGLIDAIEAIVLRQKKRTHSPQTKVLEFQVAILAGLPYLKDISRDAHPLGKDEAVARAWRQPGWADYSGVSRTLHALSMEEAQQVVQALDRLTQPFIDQEINQAYLCTGDLVWDFDLTGRPVSNSSTTYPNAAYGYMSERVQLGYQAAMVSMHSPTYGRLWLSTTPHPGDTVSCSQAEAMVLAAEAKTGVRPWRRTPLLEQRLARLANKARTAEEHLQKAEQALKQAEQRLQETLQQVQQWQQTVTQLEAEYQARHRPERPHSRLAQARKRLSVQQERQPRREKALRQAQQRLAKRQSQRDQMQAQCLELQQRLKRFERENESNPAPMPIVIRLDAGFGTPENVALLIEMGYEVYTKPQSHWVTTKLRQEAETRTDWERVGSNAEMVAWKDKALSKYPYPLDVALERFYTGDKVRHGTLLYYGDRAVTSDLPGWFRTYNARQTIEAGIKEGKNVFTMHHLKVRAEAGLLLQEHFATFAANFVRWAAHWLHTQCLHITSQTQLSPLSSVKTMVHVTAHTSAWVTWQHDGCLVRFTEYSIFAGQSIQARRYWAIQLPLLWFKSCDFVPT